MTSEHLVSKTAAAFVKILHQPQPLKISKFGTVPACDGQTDRRTERVDRE